MPSPAHIACIRTDRLGETLLTLPTVAALKAAYPAATITFVVHPALEPLLHGLAPIDDTLAVGENPAQPWYVRAWRLARVLRAKRFDLAVVANPKKELHLAVWLARIPVRVGYDRKWGRLLTHRVRDCKALGERHEVDYNMDLVRALGVSASVPSWRFPRFEPEWTDVAHVLARSGIQSSDRLIAVHPWTSNPRKQWPMERFRQLIQRVIAARTSVRMVLIGGPEERRVTDAFLAEPLPVTDMVGRLTLRQLVALLQHASILVSNDSGPMHVAAAAGTPTIALFGTQDPATGPTRWGPWGEGHTVIWKPSMEAITVEDVFNAACQHLT